VRWPAARVKLLLYGPALYYNVYDIFFGVSPCALLFWLLQP
jgi:hypothetical protein